MTVGERRRNWELARRGGLDVVVGARSAVFAPLPALGLVVVDEEHEPAYKQSERLRYHGRDVAVRRAHMLGIPILLGSATPSLESQANAARGKYRLVRWSERVDRRPHPRIQVVDLRREAVASGLISAPLRAAIAARLERREQTLLFLNRRGHSHHVQCRGCGLVPACPHCDISLTLHVEPPMLRCHYCDYSQPPASICPQCGARMFRYSGSGTQKVERELHALFPAARIVRLDTDVTRARGDVRGIVERFRRGEADVLIGTQMVAKGFDFPAVTLVGVLDADVGLHLPDFRAAERTHQLLVQVSGRAGRGPIPGEVFVQTCTPEHPAVAAAVLHDERAFLDHELEQRRAAGYPPFVRLVTLLFSGPTESAVVRAAGAAAELLRTGAATLLSPAGSPGAGLADEPEPSVRVLGPAPHAFARLRGQHRWHVLLKATDGRQLREAAQRALDHFEEQPGRAAVRMAVDVDPIDVL
jgi:primosomal protein N' (replication factor Y)